MERAVVRWMCDKIGFGDSAGGMFCSGGSLGNLTALLAMRQHCALIDVNLVGDLTGINRRRLREQQGARRVSG